LDEYGLCQTYFDPDAETKPKVRLLVPEDLAR
jgi:hypothetical protein